MTATFNCPSCGAPLDYDGSMETVRCPYCHTSVFVPEALKPPAYAANEFQPFGFQGEALEGMQEVARLARAGYKIQAIKLYRQMTSCGLAEAKAVVDGIQAGGPIPSVPISTQARGEILAGAAISAGQKAEIHQLLQANRKIEAIKLYRQLTGAGLKEAKDAVESMGELGGPAQKQGRSFKATLLKIIVGLFFLGIASIFPLTFIPMGIDSWQSNQIGAAVGAFAGAGIWALIWGGIGIFILFA